MRSNRKKTFKSNKEHLPLKRVIPTEDRPAHIRFFDTDCEEVMVHTNYNRCLGSGCALCEKGDLTRLAYLLPVLDFRAQRIGVLLILCSNAPGSLNDLVETIHSHPEHAKMDFVLGKESKMSFYIERVTTPLSNDSWIPNAIRRFNEQANKTALILAALPDAPTVEISELYLVGTGS